MHRPLSVIAAFMLLSMQTWSVLAQESTPPWPRDRVANGKIDDVICGARGADINLDGLQKKLGKGKPVISNVISDILAWDKGSLHIEAERASEYDIVGSITVSGTDPTGFCKTARGLRLGMTLDEVKAMYGQFFNIFTFPNGDVQYTAVWMQNGDFYLRMRFDKVNHRLIKIDAQYSLE